ncbi:hypothetical protein RND71_036961 [Anisodus tanguticus]|uniref:Uncharacterized protein n=1 Tax=Anisodus tanguticus TaxID=243964 RepID=A0AAE1UUM4_9SOLA|nr:hypothetical protein RND71_036961 [Anisodus tanguticus]
MEPKDLNMKHQSYHIHNPPNVLMYLHLGVLAQIPIHKILSVSLLACNNVRLQDLFCLIVLIEISLTLWRQDSSKQVNPLHDCVYCDVDLGQRIYNLSTASEVAGIWVEQDIETCIPTPHIRVYKKSERRSPNDFEMDVCLV